MISLDLMKSSEIRIAGDRSNRMETDLSHKSCFQMQGFSVQGRGVYLFEVR